MKFVLFVEGYTEKNALRDFLKRWLDPQLPRPVGIRIVRFNGWNDYINNIQGKVALNVSGRVGADVIAGVGLLDLYGPTFYPTGASTVAQRYEWAKKHLEDRVAHPQFRQHFAVHETEAWLMADPAILPVQVGRALPGNCATPETVNFIEPPSKLLDRLYRSRLNIAYKKVTDGANLFQDLDPTVAYGRCPYLKQLLDDMLKLAKS
ncbi:MAG: DUF4276 family protein [Candidatus Rokuibacteriota bacterium]